MSSKTFLTISKQECQSVYLDILDNSNKKWESGKKLAEEKEFGSAISLGIISIEELVKALVVFLDGKGFDFRHVKGIDTLFKHHQMRYLIAYAMFIMAIMGEELMQLITKIKSDPKSFVQLQDEFQKDKRGYFERSLKWYLFKKIVLLKSEFKWFSKADFFRQDGLYCDYQEQLKNPITITAKEYKQVFIRLERVRAVGFGIIEACNGNEEFYTTYLEEMKNNFKTKGYYNNMADTLAKIKLSKGNPFDFIVEFFENDKQRP